MKTGLVLTGLLAAFALSAQATEMSSVTGFEARSTLTLQSPVAAHHVFNDYDGDGKSDLAVYSHGYWSINSLTNGIILNNEGEWGGADWTPVR